MVCDGKCSEVMDGAAHYRNKAKRARQLADLAWQPDLQDTLRSLATDYDEIAEDIERGAAKIPLRRACRQVMAPLITTETSANRSSALRWGPNGTPARGIDAGVH